MAADYTSFITSEHVDKPKFSAMVDLLCGAVGKTSDAMAAIPSKFDVDKAEGEQLDIVGLWVGARRRLTVPLDIYFSWSTAGRGWNEAVWKGPGDASSGVAVLDDKTFRLVIKSLIATCQWDGTLHSFQRLMDAVMASTSNHFYAVDNQNMTMGIVVTGPPMSLVLQAIVQAGVLGMKPAGVAITSYAFPSSGGGPITASAKDFTNASGKLN